MNYCKKCDKEFPDRDNYCDSCGVKLKPKKSKKKRKVHQTEDNFEKSNKLVYLIGGIVLVAFIISIIVIFVIPFQYTATEAYTENIPKSNEYCEFRKPSIEKIEKISGRQDKRIDFNCIINFNCIITNKESQPVTLKVGIGYMGYMTFDNKFSYIERKYDSKGYLDMHDINQISKEVISVSDNQEYDHYSEQTITIQPNEENTLRTIAPETQRIYACVVETEEQEFCKTTNEIYIIKKERQVEGFATLFNQWTGKVVYYYEV